MQAVKYLTTICCLLLFGAALIQAGSPASECKGVFFMNGTRLPLGTRCCFSNSINIPNRTIQTESDIACCHYSSQPTYNKTIELCYGTKVYPRSEDQWYWEQCAPNEVYDSRYDRCVEGMSPDENKVVSKTDISTTTTSLIRTRTDPATPECNDGVEGCCAGNRLLISQLCYRGYPIVKQAPSHDAVCRWGLTYNSKESSCLPNETLEPKTHGKKLCGDQVINSTTDLCCQDEAHVDGKRLGKECCPQGVLARSSSEVCCGGNVYTKAKNKKCSGDTYTADERLNSEPIHYAYFKVESVNKTKTGKRCSASGPLYMDSQAGVIGQKFRDVTEYSGDFHLTIRGSKKLCKSLKWNKWHAVGSDKLGQSNDLVLMRKDWSTIKRLSRDQEHIFNNFLKRDRKTRKESLQRASKSRAHSHKKHG